VRSKGLLVEHCPPLGEQLTVQERPGKTCFRFWQEGPGFDRNIFSRAAVLRAIDYLHLNPVRRGLCQRTVDWRWSSARYYHLESPKQQFPELSLIQGLQVGIMD
jgi:putative transposase